MTAPPDRNLLSRWTPLVVVVVALAAAGAFVAVWSQTGKDREPADLAGPFTYDVERFRHIPEEMIGYRWAEGTERKDPKDEPLKVNDHAVDPLRYAIFGVEGNFLFAGTDLS